MFVFLHPLFIYILSCIFNSSTRFSHYQLPCRLLWVVMLLHPQSPTTCINWSADMPPCHDKMLLRIFCPSYHRSFSLSECTQLVVTVRFESLSLVARHTLYCILSMPSVSHFTVSLYKPLICIWCFPRLCTSDGHSLSKDCSKCCLIAV